MTEKEPEFCTDFYTDFTTNQYRNWVLYQLRYCAIFELL